MKSLGIKSIFFVLFLCIAFQSNAKTKEFQLSFSSPTQASINGSKKRFKDPKLLFGTIKLGRNTIVEIDINYEKELAPTIYKLINFLISKKVNQISFYDPNEEAFRKHEWIWAPLPKYPDNILVNQDSANVTLSFILDQLGRIQDIHIVSPRSLEIENLAIANLYSWKAKPVIQNGRAVPAKIQVVFTINKDHSTTLSNLKIEKTGNSLSHLLTPNDTVEFLGYCEHARGELKSKKMSFRKGTVVCTSTELLIISGDYQNPRSAIRTRIPYSEIQSSGYKRLLALSQIQILSNGELHVIKLISRNGSVDGKGNKKLRKTLHNKGITEWKPISHYMNNDIYYENPPEDASMTSLYGSKVESTSVLSFVDEFTYIRAIGDFAIKDGKKKILEPIQLERGKHQVQLVYEKGMMYAISNSQILVEKKTEIIAKSEWVRNLRRVKMWIEDKKTGKLIGDVVLVRIHQKSQTVIVI